MFRGDKMTDLKCSICGSKRKVFFDVELEKDSNTYKLIPICLHCKSTKLDLAEVVGWEKKLKNLEKQISVRLIADYFPKIKFKKTAQHMLENLMKKYSIRKVFEVCSLLSGNFNLHKIETKCKQE